MGDHRYLVQQFHSQESARWKNKIENNRLANEIGGKGGIEYERAFHLKTIDQERRRIEGELGSIRRHGRRKDIRRYSQPEILTTSLNPPLRKRDTGNRERNFPAFPQARRSTLGGYYDKSLMPSPQARKEKVIKADPPQRRSLDNPGEVASSEPLLTRSELVDKQLGVIIADHTEKEPENPLTNPVLYQRRHMVQFVDESHLAHSKGKSSKFGAGSTVIYYPKTNSGDPDSPQWLRQNKPSNTQTGIAELSVSTAKDNVVRRLVDPNSAYPDRAQGKGDSEPVINSPSPRPGLGIQEVSNTTTEQAADMAANSSTQNSTKIGSGDQKVRRGSKTNPNNNNSTDLLKGSKFDMDKYNPDGSLRTKHQLPSFEESYEQAKNARYIRSKERSDLDRELEIGEVFERPNKTKDAGARSSSE